MQKVQPFRDETMKKPEDLRVRLNELVDTVNDGPKRWRAMRIPNVQREMKVVLADPGFPVGAIVLGGITPTNGGAIPTAAPWVSDWVQQADGRITLTVKDLSSGGKTYVVNLVLFEGEAS